MIAKWETNFEISTLRREAEKEMRDIEDVINKLSGFSLKLVHACNNSFY